MPWVLYDDEDNTYCCLEEFYDRGGELWLEDLSKATRFETAALAQQELEDIDVEGCLLERIHPRYIEPELKTKAIEEVELAGKVEAVLGGFEVKAPKAKLTTRSPYLNYTYQTEGT